MTQWLRFTRAGRPGFGTLDGDTISVHEGDMYAAPVATGEKVRLPDVTLDTPSRPSKMIAIWNNFHALAAKLGNAIPQEPLYFIKTSNAYLPSGGVIRKPKSFDGKIIYEGELGIVIGCTCKEVAATEASQYIFGYTCVNDVTAADIIMRDPAFQQWTRAKSFDTFGVFGPAIATGLDPGRLTVRTVLNGQERQNYPVADMIFSPAELVSRISHDMTLYPGDVICCGTSLGVGSMKPGSSVEVIIEGIGTLSNRFE
jgi:2-keto-4-pentenoate hydratase/2-oxohepta-3-ene-1,7-dioic acid hydratase in catechol pathway